MDTRSENEPRPLASLAHELAELLDKVGVPTIQGTAAQLKLSELMDEWKAGGGPRNGQDLIQKAQGVVGMVNSTGSAEAAQNHAYRALTDYKNELRRLAREDSA